MEQALGDRLESDAQFRAQFDRSSESFHNGDTTPVPIGGQRVPEGVSELPENSVEESKIPASAEYERVMSTRAFLQEFKKIVSLVCPAVESRFRISSSNNSEDRERLLAEAASKIQEVLNKVQTCQAQLVPLSDLISDYTEEFNYIFNNALNEYSSKENYGEFMLKVGNFSKKIFKDITSLLQVIKDLKKKA